jgi:hypothetical protein
MFFKASIGIVLVLQVVAAADAGVSPTVKDWVDITLSHFDEVWDDETDMVSDSRGHGTRKTMFYALGLLQRGQEEDRDRACRAIRAVCLQQFIAPGKNYHGTFGRSDNEQAPEGDGIVWKDYDPNWREFVGLSMILALEHCNEVVDDVTRDAMLNSLRYACEGAYERNVRWNYTNISLMSAFLLAWGGKQFDIMEWKKRGEELSLEIYDNFQKHKTFSEYNSPTYNGVNLWALAAWRRFAPTQQMTTMANEMEADLWRDIARAYHAGLGNVCGPYDRSYGMDMGDYFAITGIAIALATESPVSMPSLIEGGSHFSEIAYLPLLALLGLNVPDDALSRLKTFTGEQRYARIIEDGRVDRRAYSFLYDNCMVGVETNSRASRSSTQYHPFTVHWRGEKDEICWLRFVGETPVIVSLSDTAVQIVPAHKKSNVVLRFEVYAPGATPASFTPETWNLPGMSVKTPTVPADPVVTKQRDRLTISYEIAAGSEEAKLIVKVK